MERRAYHATEGHLLKILKFMEKMASEKEAYKIFYSRGLAIYQIPIGLEPQEGLSASIEIENVVLMLDFISRGIITSGSPESSDTVISKLEKKLQGRLKLKEPILGLDH